MRIIERYILTRLFFPFIYGVGLFSLILLLGFIPNVTDSILTNRLPFGVVATAILLYILRTFNYTIPIGVLVANLITWGRLRERGEIMALQTSGVSLLPTVFLVLITSGILSIGLYLSCELSVSINSKLGRLLKNPGGVGLIEGVFMEFNSHEIFIKRIKKKRLYGIYIYDRGSIDGQRRIILARYGEYWTEPSFQDTLRIGFTLYDGTIQQLERNLKRYHLLRFTTHTIFIPVKMEVNVKERVEDMTSKALLEKIEEGRRYGFDPVPLMIEFHKRRAIPFSCLCFALIGIPVGLLTKQRNPGVGFALSIPFVFLYYLGLIGGEALSLKGLVSPLHGVWMPNLLFSIVGLLLTTRLLHR